MPTLLPMMRQPHDQPQEEGPCKAQGLVHLFHLRIDPSIPSIEYYLANIPGNNRNNKAKSDADADAPADDEATPEPGPKGKARVKRKAAGHEPISPDNDDVKGNETAHGAEATDDNPSKKKRAPRKPKEPSQRSLFTASHHQSPYIFDYQNLFHIVSLSNHPFDHQ